jgi:hypothetical protein
MTIPKCQLQDEWRCKESTIMAGTNTLGGLTMIRYSYGLGRHRDHHTAQDSQLNVGLSVVKSLSF